MPTIPESRNVKVAMKNIDEEENEDFCEEEYFNSEELSFSEEKTFYHDKLSCFNHSLQSRDFPENLKSADIIPVHKKNSKHDKDNYRSKVYFHILKN